LFWKKKKNCSIVKENKMSQYAGIVDMGIGRTVGLNSVPPQSTQMIMKPYSAGYDSLTHFVPESENYYQVTNAYLLPQIQTCGYYPVFRKATGTKLYNSPNFQS
tara:strand:+ start:990 stop:1301 length:312 start_codon:yes stop_codon:yes gene_type:complete